MNIQWEYNNERSFRLWQDRHGKCRSREIIAAGGIGIYMDQKARYGKDNKSGSWRVVLVLSELGP